MFTVSPQVLRQAHHRRRRYSRSRVPDSWRMNGLKQCSSASERAPFSLLFYFIIFRREEVPHSTNTDDVGWELGPHLDVLARRLVFSSTASPLPEPSTTNNSAQNTSWLVYSQKPSLLFTSTSPHHSRHEPPSASLGPCTYYNCLPFAA